ncbi:MAG: class I SAM-dependent methyltransferase [Verrucomicrobia bacterium]|nr:class I SAM-dependent methyltransferase [Verrucomicrobiota bacterium]
MIPFKDKGAVEKQRDYYHQTALRYDEMHNAKTGEHALALKYFLSFARQYHWRSVLDVGCGTGVALGQMLEAGLSAVGIEPVESLIRVATKKHRIPGMRIAAGSAEKLPYADGSFDAVTEFGVLHHVPQPRLAVSEMLRVARHGIFLSDENRFGRGSSLWRLIKYFWWVLGVFPLGYLLMTRGKGFHETEGDGISFSYSVYDSYQQISQWADVVFMIPLKKADKIHRFHPLFSTSHILLCALRHPEAYAD